MPASRIPKTIARGKPKPNLHRRGRQHLAFVRQLPCVACGKAAPSEAAHVRTGTDSGGRDQAGRSLRGTAVLRLSHKTASDWRAYLLVRTPHRSSQCGFAAMDGVVRHSGRAAHYLSGTPTDRSLESLQPIKAREPRNYSSRRLTFGYPVEWRCGSRCCAFGPPRSSRFSPCSTNC